MAILAVLCNHRVAINVHWFYGEPEETRMFHGCFTKQRRSDTFFIGYVVSIKQVAYDVYRLFPKL